MAHPCDDDAFTGNDEQIEELKHAVYELVGDVEYLLDRVHKHLVDPARIAEIRKRAKFLGAEDFENLEEE